MNYYPTLDISIICPHKTFQYQHTNDHNSLTCTDWLVEYYLSAVILFNCYTTLPWLQWAVLARYWQCKSAKRRIKRKAIHLNPKCIRYLVQHVYFDSYTPSLCEEKFSIRSLVLTMIIIMIIITIQKALFIEWTHLITIRNLRIRPSNSQTFDNNN